MWTIRQDFGKKENEIVNRITKKYLSNNKVTLDAAQFGVDQVELDKAIMNSEPIKAAVERLAEFEDTEEKSCMK